MFKLIRLTVFFQALGYLLQFGAFFLFAKMLGAENQGILTIFRASGQIVASLLLFGLPGGIVYFVGKDRDLLLPVLGNCVKLFLVVFPLLALFLYILPIDKLPKVYLIGKYIPYLLVFVFFLSFFGIFQLSILSLKKYLYYNLFAFGAGFIMFGFSVSIWFTPDIYNKLNLAIIAYLVTYGLMFTYGAALIFNENGKVKNRKKWLPFVEQFKVGFRGFISNLAGLLLFRLDLFLVGYFLSLKDVGVYSIALFGAEMVTKIPGWSAAILTPMVASNEGGHVRRTVYLFYSAIIIALLLGVFFVLGIMMVPDFVSNLIGKDFTGVEICLLLLLPRVVMQSGVGILAANLAGKGYPWYHPGGNIAGLIFVVLLDLLLIPRYGIAGAALANSLGYGACLLINYLGFCKYNDTSVNNMISLFKLFIIDIKTKLKIGCING